MFIEAPEVGFLRTYTNVIIPSFIEGFLVVSAGVIFLVRNALEYMKISL